MKITRRQLRRLIKEELETALIEQPVPGAPPSQTGAYGWRTGIPPEPGQEDKEGMKAFIVKQFVEPGEYGMQGEDFDVALENFEVQFRIEFPDSIFKIYDVLNEDPKFGGLGEFGLANGLRALYPADFDARDEREREY